MKTEEEFDEVAQRIEKEVGHALLRQNDLWRNGMIMAKSLMVGPEHSGCRRIVEQVSHEVHTKVAKATNEVFNDEPRGK